MSYILEALKRAERERAQGQQASGADGGAPASSAPARTGLLIKVLIAVLAVNALVFGALLLRPAKAPEPVETVAQPQRAAAPSSSTPAAISKPAPPTIPPPARDEPVVEQGVASMDDLGASSDADELAKPIVKGAATAQAPRGRVTFSTKPLSPELTQAPSDVVEDEGIEEPEPPADEPEDAPVEAIAAPSPPPAATARSTAGYKMLAETSAAYQATFPNYKMEVHVHDAQPQRRFVLIEGKRYKEGDALPQNARLVQIVPEGIVVDFRNEKVLFPIGRH